MVVNFLNKPRNSKYFRRQALFLRFLRFCFSFVQDLLEIEDTAEFVDLQSTE